MHVILLEYAAAPLSVTFRISLNYCYQALGSKFSKYSHANTGTPLCTSEYCSHVTTSDQRDADSDHKLTSGSCIQVETAHKR